MLARSLSPPFGLSIALLAGCATGRDVVPIARADFERDDRTPDHACSPPAPTEEITWWAPRDHVSPPAIEPVVPTECSLQRLPIDWPFLLRAFGRCHQIAGGEALEPERKVTVEMEVDAEGHVHSAQVTQSDGPPLLTACAVETFASVRYTIAPPVARRRWPCSSSSTIDGRDI